MFKFKISAEQLNQTASTAVQIIIPHQFQILYGEITFVFPDFNDLKMLVVFYFLVFIKLLSCQKVSEHEKDIKVNTEPGEQVNTSTLLLVSSKNSSEVGGIPYTVFLLQKKGEFAKVKPQN